MKETRRVASPLGAFCLMRLVMSLHNKAEFGNDKQREPGGDW